jgi:hypothetical protein
MEMHEGCISNQQSILGLMNGTAHATGGNVVKRGAGRRHETGPLLLRYRLFEGHRHWALHSLQSEQRIRARADTLKTLCKAARLHA